MKVILTVEERNLLLDKVVLPLHLKEIILNISENSESNISEDDSSDLRECCTDALDLIGFDLNDEVLFYLTNI